MIAIVYYEEASLLPIVSILISLLSVASKSFVFSVSAGINVETIVFYWLCAVTDFFGIFFIVTWVFYIPNSDIDYVNEHETLNDIISVHIISQLWFYKVLIIIVPLATMVTLILFGILLSETSDDNICCILIFSLFGIPFGMIFLSIAFEVSTFIFIAFIINKYYTSRFPTNNENFIAWNELIDWIYDNKGYDIQDLIHEIDTLNKLQKDNNNNDNDNDTDDNSYQVQTPYECSARQDRIIRICCINYCYFRRGLYAFESDMNQNSIGTRIDFRTRFEENERNNRNRSRVKKESKYRDRDKELQPADDIMLRNFLSKPENINKCFVDIDYNDIKQNANQFQRKRRIYNDHNSIIARFYSGYVSFWDEIKDIIPNCLIELLLNVVVYVLAPLYLISRIIGLIFPIIIILYVNGNGLWNDIDGLQWSLLGIYTFLFVTVIILCLYIVPRAYYQSFILPGARLFPTLIPSAKLFVNFVKEYCYPKLIITPIRDYLIKDVFGVDVGCIILGYLGDLNVDDGKTVLNFMQFKQAMGNV